MNINSSTRPRTGSLRLTERDMKRREEFRKWKQDHNIQEWDDSSFTTSSTSRSGSSTPSRASKKRDAPSSGYPGVYWNKGKKKFEAQITDEQGHTRYLGAYDSPKEAYAVVQAEGGDKSSSCEPTNIIGVTWHKGNKQWVAKYSHQGQKITVGYFYSQEEAKRALDEQRARRGLPEMGTSRRAHR